MIDRVHARTCTLQSWQHLALRRSGCEGPECFMYHPAKCGSCLPPGSVAGLSSLRLTLTLPDMSIKVYLWNLMACVTPCMDWEIGTLFGGMWGVGACGPWLEASFTSSGQLSLDDVLPSPCTVCDKDWSCLQPLTQLDDQKGGGCVASHVCSCTQLALHAPHATQFWLCLKVIQPKPGKPCLQAGVLRAQGPSMGHMFSAEQHS